MSRTLAIGLDGFELSLALAMIERGELPNLAALRSQSARFELDHGDDKYSGLAWEHVSSGVAPSDGARWSAVNFDPAEYRALQTHTASRPFVAELPIRTVVFDTPYWDLAGAEAVRGLVDWGAHDPGIAQAARPEGLAAEVSARFGAYPATKWIYGFSWPSARKTRESATALVEAVNLRASVSEWLLTERLPDWDLALVVISECHSAIEPMWHGIDPTHPLHVLPSAEPAREGMYAVYRAIDAMIGRLRAALPDTALAVFAMHGMGTNQADVAAMALLPELLYRDAFGGAYMSERDWSSYLPDGTPLLGKDEDWQRELGLLVPIAEPQTRSAWRRLRDRLLRAGTSAANPRLHPGALLWMPAARYSALWPSMPAFALPSFYDGRVRINLRGRESAGIVARREYPETVRRIADLLHECREPLEGKEVVERIDFFDGAPEALPDSQADVTVVWRNRPIGLVHPRLGRIGPLPWRRTGGHTGDCGFLFLAGTELRTGDCGRASSFDVVPTLVEMVGAGRNTVVSGRSLLDRAIAAPLG